MYRPIHYIYHNPTTKQISRDLSTDEKELLDWLKMVIENDDITNYQLFYQTLKKRIMNLKKKE